MAGQGKAASRPELAAVHRARHREFGCVCGLLFFTLDLEAGAIPGGAALCAGLRPDPAAGCRIRNSGPLRAMYGTAPHLGSCAIRRSVSRLGARSEANGEGDSTGVARQVAVAVEVSGEVVSG